ncbi:MAG: type II toxin-antitoxin system RelE/ParE family toxin [Nocardioidaceae bacterium]
MTGPRRPREHPAARAERAAAARWYERRERGLGRRFLDNTIAARKSVEDSPESWGRYHQWDLDAPVVRARSVAKFPYDIIYFVTDGGEIVIVAYASESREPNYWADRLDD